MHRTSRDVQASRAAMVSVLGSLGSGASGSPTSNFETSLNTVAVAPVVSPRYDSVNPFVSRTGRVLVTVKATVSKNGGTFAVADPVVFTMARDSGGGQVNIGPQTRTVGATDGADVVANATLTWVDTVTPGSSHTWGIVGAVQGGHTAGIIVGEGSVTLVDI